MGEVSGTGFGVAAAAYQRGRPGYPSESVARLLGDAEVIADVGAGTGKLTADLLGGGRRVIAVEPDERMLAALAASLPEVDPRIGAAEALPLEDSSIDLLAFGQSWHWVDPAAACAEAARVLRPGGALGLIWNIRDESVDWVVELTDIIAPSAAEKYVAGLLGTEAAGESVGRPPAAVTPVPRSPLTEAFDAPVHHGVDWIRVMAVDQLVDMVASRSFTIAAESDVRQSILERTRDLGERVRRADGLIHFPYTTHVFKAGLASG